MWAVGGLVPAEERRTGCMVEAMVRRPEVEVGVEGIQRQIRYVVVEYLA